MEEQETWQEWFCPECGTEAAFFGGPPDEWEFHCECDETEEED